MENRGTWTDLIMGVGLEIEEVFDQGQEAYLPGINRVLIQTTGTGAQHTFTSKTGFGELVELEEGEAVSLAKRTHGFTTTVAYNGYSKGVTVTKWEMEDRNFEQQLDEMKDLGLAVNRSQDKSGLQLFNGGFATTRKVNGYTMTYYNDGVPTFSTVHPSPVTGVSTQSNASSTSVAFSKENLQTEKINLRLQKDDDGLPIDSGSRVAIVGPLALEEDFLVTTGSELDPDNANNAINIHKGTTDVITSLYLDSTNGGSDTAWFLVEPGTTKFYHEVRQAPVLETAKDIMTKSATFTVDARWANFVKDYRHSRGSKGDGSAYSS